MQGVCCPGDVHWARLEASALGSLCWLPGMEEKREESRCLCQHNCQRQRRTADEWVVGCWIIPAWVPYSRCGRSKAL